MNTIEKEGSKDNFVSRLMKFDNYPIPLQALIMLLGLAFITAVGLGVWFAVDILLLDWDPIAKIATAITGLFR